MFGRIGPMEIILILVVALLIFGPKKLPEIGKSIGNAIREFRKHSNKLQEELNVLDKPPVASPPPPVRTAEAKPVEKPVDKPLDVSADKPTANGNPETAHIGKVVEVKLEPEPSSAASVKTQSPVAEVGGPGSIPSVSGVSAASEKAEKSSARKTKSGMEKATSSAKSKPAAAKAKSKAAPAKPARKSAPKTAAAGGASARTRKTKVDRT